MVYRTQKMLVNYEKNNDLCKTRDHYFISSFIYLLIQGDYSLWKQKQNLN